MPTPSPIFIPNARPRHPVMSGEDDEESEESESESEGSEGARPVVDENEGRKFEAEAASELDEPDDEAPVVDGILFCRLSGRRKTAFAATETVARTPEPEYVVGVHWGVTI